MIKKWLIATIVTIGVVLGALVIITCGDKSDKSVVWAVLPITGAGSIWGEHFKAGLDIYNKTHSTNANIMVRLIDSQSDASKAISAINQQYSMEKPSAIISVMSPVTVSVADWCANNDVFLFGCVVSEKIFTSPNVQRIYPSASDNVRDVVRVASRYKTMSLLCSNDEFGLASKTIFETGYRKSGGTILFDGIYNAKDVSIREVVIKATAKQPEAVFITGLGVGYWLIFRELRAIGYNGQIISECSFADIEQIKKLGEIAEGIIFTASETELSDSIVPSVRALRKEYNDYLHREPNYVGVAVYEALCICDKIISDGQSISRDSIKKMQYWDGAVGKIRFADNGECEYPWFAVKIDNGKIVRCQ